MSERLRPRDLAFLAEESAVDADAQRDRRDLRAGRLGLRLRPAGRADRATGSRSCPRYRQRVQTVPGPARQPGLGRRRPTSTSATTYAAPRCRGRARLDQLRELVARIVSRPLDRAPAAVGDLLRRGARRRPGRAALQVPPGPGRRRRHRRPRPGAARRRRRSRKELGADDWQPRRATRRRPGWWPSAVARLRRATARRWSSTRSAATPRRGAARRRATPAAASARSSTRWPTGARRRSRRSIGAAAPQQRRFVTVRTDLADYRKVREAHGGTVNDVILATVTGALRAWLMTRGESMPGDAPDPGAWCRCR